MSVSLVVAVAVVEMETSECFSWGNSAVIILGVVVGDVVDVVMIRAIMRDSSLELLFSLCCVTESLIVSVSFVTSVSGCFRRLCDLSGVVQVVALVGESVIVNFFMSVRSAWSMSHSESMTYFRCAVGYASMDLSFLIMLRLSVYKCILQEIAIASVISSS